VGNAPPEVYFADLTKQVTGGKKKYGGITDETELLANLRAHCIPPSLRDGPFPDYDTFLQQRRGLMSSKIASWFDSL
jgi:hypothetical protein